MTTAPSAARSDSFRRLLLPTDRRSMRISATAAHAGAKHLGQNANGSSYCSRLDSHDIALVWMPHLARRCATHSGRECCDGRFVSYFQLSGTSRLREQPNLHEGVRTRFVSAELLLTNRIRIDSGFEKYPAA